MRNFRVRALGAALGIAVIALAVPLALAPAFAQDEPPGGIGGDEPGGDQPGGIGGDQPGGDEPGGIGGDEPGGDQPGGDQPGGIGGDQPGGDQPGGDQPGGIGGDQPGGDQPGGIGGEQPGGTPENAPSAPAGGSGKLGKFSKLFKQKCESCHTFGKGDRIGPDLLGVFERRSVEWLAKFIRTPNPFLDSDAALGELVKKYNGLRMPNLGLTKAQATGLAQLVFLASEDPAVFSAGAPTIPPAALATSADFQLGEELFTGRTPFRNGAPACLACHTVDGVGGPAPGGILAAGVREEAGNLTHAFARLRDSGVHGALADPSFRLMKDVYGGDHGLTPDEAFAVRAFLYDRNRRPVVATESVSLFLLGLLGAAFGLVVLNTVWARRLKDVRYRLTHRRETPA